MYYICIYNTYKVPVVKLLNSALEIISIIIMVIIFIVIGS